MAFLSFDRSNMFLYLVDCIHFKIVCKIWNILHQIFCLMFLQQIHVHQKSVIMLYVGALWANVWRDRVMMMLFSVGELIFGLCCIWISVVSVLVVEKEGVENLAHYPCTWTGVKSNVLNMLHTKQMMTYEVFLVAWPPPSVFSVVMFSLTKIKLAINGNWTFS